MKTNFINNCYSFMNEKQKHYVVYVAYNDNIPHDVKTVHYIANAVNGPYWRLYHWDFSIADKDLKDIICFNSGSGSNQNSIQASRYVDGYLCKYWLADGLKLNGIPKNMKRIWTLIEHESYISKSSNPFDFSEIVSQIEFCPKCESYSREYCNIHTYFDDEGNQRYKGNHKYVRQ